MQVRSVIPQDLRTKASPTFAKVKLGGAVAVVPFILTTTISGAGTTTIFDANAPIAFRVIDAWSINTAATAGSWKLTDGTNDIISDLSPKATDRIRTPWTQLSTSDISIDDAYHEIAVNGTLAIVNHEKSPADCIVYILCIPT